MSDTQIQFDLLKKAYFHNRLSHAYVLSGMAGIGKTDFARSFSKFLLCEKKLAHHACGKCRSCHWMDAETHPDFLFIQPEEKSHSVKIDQIREFCEKLSQTSQCGGYQVVIVSPADAMPNQAANALLKTLEEPTGKVIIFLVDDQHSIIPSTILSRCQKIFFSSDHVDLRMHDKTLALRDQLLDHLKKIIVNRANPIAFNLAWLKINSEDLLTQLLLLSSDISRIQLGVQSGDIINHDVIHALSEIAATLDRIALQQWIQKCIEKKSMLSRGMNLNAQLMLEDIFIAWDKV